MLISIILIFGCLSFICIGVAAVSWASVNMEEEGIDIKSLVMLIAGIAVIVFAYQGVGASIESYYKKEFTTSAPSQIDTTVTIKNGVVDTLYTYHLKEN